MIVARYFARETSSTFAAVLAVLLAIFTSQQFVRFLGNALDGHIAQDTVLSMLGLQIPIMLPLLLPLAFFLGVLLAVGRLHVDSEIVVLRAGGYSEWRFLAWLALPALVLAAAVGGVSFALAPWAETAQHRLYQDFASRGDTAQLSPGRFQELAGGQRVIYVEGFDEAKRLRQVFIADLPAPAGGEPFKLVTAKAGAIRVDERGDEYLELSDGERYEGEPGRRDYTVTAFARHQTLLKVKESRWERDLKSYSVAELRTLPPSPEVAAEWHWRFAIPLSVLLLGALALPLARTRPRQGRYAGVLPGIGLYLGYMLLLMAGRRALENGRLPELVGLWPVHGLALLLACVLLARGNGWPWRKAVRA